MQDNVPFLNLPIFKKLRTWDNNGATTSSTASDKPKESRPDGANKSQA
jgi:hypothetical protein